MFVSSIIVLEVSVNKSGALLLNGVENVIVGLFVEICPIVVAVLKARAVVVVNEAV